VSSDVCAWRRDAAVGRYQGCKAEIEAFMLLKAAEYDRYLRDMDLVFVGSMVDNYDHAYRRNCKKARDKAARDKRKKVKLEGR
jgi:hypothetical protein